MGHDIGKILGEHSLFKNLPQEDIDRLRDLVTTRTLKANEVVFLKGDEGNAMMAVLSGQIRICSYSAEGREIVLNVMNPGDVFGEIAMIDGGERTADAFTMERTEVLVLFRRDFMPFLEAHPTVAIKLLQVLCQRLRRTSEQVEDYFFLDLRSRLAKCLLQLARQTDAVHNKDATVTIRASQNLLASIIGTSREAVNKQLRAWENMSLIVLKRGSITLVDIEALEDIIDDGSG